MYTVLYDPTNNPVDENGFLNGVGGVGTPLIVNVRHQSGQIVPWSTTAHGSVPHSSVRR